MDSTSDLNGEVAQIVKQCRAIESDWLADLNAPVTSVPYKVAQAIMLGRILSRADSDLARLIIQAMHSSHNEDDPCGREEGFNLERELASYSARFEWKRQVAELENSGADAEQIFWAGYQFHADMMDNLTTIGEPESEQD